MTFDCCAINSINISIVCQPNDDANICDVLIKCARRFSSSRLIAMKFQIFYNIPNWYPSSIYLLLEAMRICKGGKKLYRFKRIEVLRAHQQL